MYKEEAYIRWKRENSGMFKGDAEPDLFADRDIAEQLLEVRIRLAFMAGWNARDGEMKNANHER